MRSKALWTFSFYAFQDNNTKECTDCNHWEKGWRPLLYLIYVCMWYDGIFIMHETNQQTSMTRHTHHCICLCSLCPRVWQVWYYIQRDCCVSWRFFRHCSLRLERDLCWPAPGWSEKRQPSSSNDSFLIFEEGKIERLETRRGKRSAAKEVKSLVRPKGENLCCIPWTSSDRKWSGG